MAQERKFTGVWIPEIIWLNKQLSAIDKVILTEIDSLDNENHCTAGNEYFAEFCDVSEKTVSRSIQKLIDLGYVTKIGFDGRIRTLRSNLQVRVDKMSYENGQNVQSERSKCPVINKYTNKSNNISIKEGRNFMDYNDSSKIATKETISYDDTF